jgi:hypothetical protein
MRAEPSFKVARIVYFTNLTSDRARVIPLGTLSEVLMPHVHALALKAREDLAPDELALVSPLIREKLANPFAFLRMEFDKAWEAAAPGRALEFLSKIHTTSLSVLAPTDYSERGWLLSRIMAPRGDAVEGKLSAAVDSEFSELLKRYGGHAAAPRKVIESAESRDAA